MRQVEFLRRHAGPLCVLAVLSSLWLWLLALGVFDIGIRGIGGSVTRVLMPLYGVLVPVASIATVVSAVVGAVRGRLPLPIAIGHVLVVALALGVWWWSLTVMEG